MFDQIAGRYDLLNRLMSFGCDGLWRRRLVAALRPQPGAHILDVATGTADVALAICRRQPAARVTGLDPSAAMLQQGRHKVARAQLQAAIVLQDGDAQALPFASNSFDGACISFGIRNVPDRLRGMQEMARVCRPGAPVVVLELGEPQQSWLSPLARLHVHLVVPLLGRLLGRQREYAYLQRSIAAFMPPEAFLALLGQAGLLRLQHRPMMFGAVNLFVAQAPLSPS